MAYSGLVLDEGDEQIEFLATAADTGGELVSCRIWVAPSRPAPPEHSHPWQEETFRVERGRLGYISGTTAREGKVGETVVVPAGTNHTFWNAGDEPLVLVADIRPAMRFEDFAETIHVLIRDGRLAAGGRRPNPLVIAVVAMAYRDEWRLTNLSPIARFLLPAMAFLGRSAGYRSHYSVDDEHSSTDAPATV